jgi:hypothetical protein
VGYERANDSQARTVLVRPWRTSNLVIVMKNSFLLLLSIASRFSIILLSNSSAIGMAPSATSTMRSVVNPETTKTSLSRKLDWCFRSLPQAEKGRTVSD